MVFYVSGDADFHEDFVEILQKGLTLRPTYGILSGGAKNCGGFVEICDSRKVLPGNMLSSCRGILKIEHLFVFPSYGDFVNFKIPIDNKSRI